MKIVCISNLMFLPIYKCLLKKKQQHFYCHTFSAFQYSVKGFEPIIMLSMRCQSFSSLQLKKVRTKQLLISSILCSCVNSSLSQQCGLTFAPLEISQLTFENSFIYLHVKTFQWQEALPQEPYGWSSNFSRREHSLESRAEHLNLALLV